MGISQAVMYAFVYIAVGILLRALTSADSFAILISSPSLDTVLWVLYLGFGVAQLSRLASKYFLYRKLEADEHESQKVATEANDESDH